MAYAFNDDKSKADVYTKAEVYTKADVYTKAETRTSINVSAGATKTQQFDASLSPRVLVTSASNSTAYNGIYLLTASAVYPIISASNLIVSVSNETVTVQNRSTVASTACRGVII